MTVGDGPAVDYNVPMLLRGAAPGPWPTAEAASKMKSKRVIKIGRGAA